MIKMGDLEKISERLEVSMAEPVAPARVHHFIAYCDGGALDNQKVNGESIGYGSFIIEIPSRGFVSPQKRISYGPGFTNNEAEYRAIINALEMIRDVIQAEGARTSAYNVLIMTDSQLVIGHMTLGWRVKAANLISYRQQLAGAVDWFGNVDFNKISGEKMKEILGH